MSVNSCRGRWVIENMAKRRMFSKDVINLDSFMDMPLSARALYFHLGMEADDDGFLGNPKMIVRSVGCSQGDLEHLVAKGFVCAFKTGVIVITHWNQNNHIQKDRYHETTFLSEKARLQLVNNTYIHVDTDCIQDVSREDTGCIQNENDIKTSELREDSTQNEMYPPCIQTVSKMDTKSRLGQVRLGQARLGQVSLGQSSPEETDGQTDTRLLDLARHFFQAFHDRPSQQLGTAMSDALKAGLPYGTVQQAIDDAAARQPDHPSAYTVTVLQDYIRRGGAPTLFPANQQSHPDDPLQGWEQDWLEEFNAAKRCLQQTQNTQQ